MLSPYSIRGGSNKFFAHEGNFIWGQSGKNFQDISCTSFANLLDGKKTKLGSNLNKKKIGESH